MTAKEMRLAAKLLSGEPIENVETTDVNDDFDRLYVSDSEDESFTEIEKDRTNRLQRANELVYNDSDNDEEQRSALNPKQTKTSKVVSIRSRLAQLEDSDSESDIATGNYTVIFCFYFCSLSKQNKTKQFFFFCFKRKCYIGKGDKQR